MAGGTPAALWQSGLLAQALDLAAEIKSRGAFQKFCIKKIFNHSRIYFNFLIKGTL